MRVTDDEFQRMVEDPEGRRFLMSLTDEEKETLASAASTGRKILGYVERSRRGAALSSADLLDLRYLQAEMERLVAAIKQIETKYTPDGDRLH